jgi:hypothetical protein
VNVLLLLVFLMKEEMGQQVEKRASLPRSWVDEKALAAKEEARLQKLEMDKQKRLQREMEKMQKRQLLEEVRRQRLLAVQTRAEDPSFRLTVEGKMVQKVGEMSTASSLQVLIRDVSESVKSLKASSKSLSSHLYKKGQKDKAATPLEEMEDEEVAQAKEELRMIEMEETAVEMINNLLRGTPSQPAENFHKRQSKALLSSSEEGTFRQLLARRLSKMKNTELEELVSSRLTSQIKLTPTFEVKLQTLCGDLTKKICKQARRKARPPGKLSFAESIDQDEEFWRKEKMLSRKVMAKESNRAKKRAKTGLRQLNDITKKLAKEAKDDQHAVKLQSKVSTATSKVLEDQELILAMRVEGAKLNEESTSTLIARMTAQVAGMTSAEKLEKNRELKKGLIFDARTRVMKEEVKKQKVLDGKIHRLQLSTSGSDFNWDQKHKALLKKLHSSQKRFMAHVVAKVNTTRD